MKQRNARTHHRFISLFLLLSAGAPAIAAAQSPPRPPHPPRAFVWKSLGRGYLGVQVMGLTPELRRHFGAPEDAGVLVSRVEEGSPADSAGVVVGDVLTSVDGTSVRSAHALHGAVRGKKAGETVALEVVRDRAIQSFPVAVEERDRPVLDLAGPPLVPELPDFPELEGFPGARLFIAGPGPQLDEDALEAFEEAMRGIEERFQSEEWQERLKRLRELDLSKLQERMKELEERLRELESEIEREGKNDRGR